MGSSIDIRGFAATGSRPASEGTAPWVANHPGMGITYAVSWTHAEGRFDSGRLVLGPSALRLEGADTIEVDYEDVTEISIGRGHGERLRGRTIVLVSRVNGRPILIAPVAQHAALLELHERLQARVSCE
jgi:hypothetical protein